MDGFCKPRCEDCRYFLGDPDDDSSGFCRFNPPSRGVAMSDGWPRVLNDHWCGRFRNIDGEKYGLWDIPEDVHKAKIDP